jgi:hypothetical protein
MARTVSAEQNGQNALRTVSRVLTSIGWHPQETEYEGVLRVDFSGDHIPISEALADVRIEYERFIYFLNFGERVPPDRCDEMAEFLTRANFGLVIGCFEFDLDDGRVRFRSSIDFTNSELTETLIRNSIRSSMDAVERYGDAIVKVLRGELDAMQAIKEVETGADQGAS